MYTELTAGDRTYKLRLTTQGTIRLEKKLGYNPLQIFMGIDQDVLPKVSDMIIVLHEMLQTYEHGITEKDTADIFDAFLEDGHSIWDIVPVIVDTLESAGFLPKGDGSKN